MKTSRRLTRRSWYSAVDPVDAPGFQELTEDEDYTLYLRLLDREYLFPVASEFEPFSDSWGEDRSQNDQVGVSGRHHGTDIMAAKGTPLVAVTSGTVETAGWNFLGGWTVTLLDDDGFRYYYAHLAERPPVTVGQEIHRGEIIGAVGDSGEGPEGTTGRMPAHLHFGIYTSDTGLVTNPYPYLTRWANGDHSDHIGITPVEPPPGWVPVDGFAWPSEGPITSRFGMRISPIDGERRLHAGIDLGVVTGTSVRATKDGQVTLAGWSEVYGWVVVVDHGDGYYSLYAHNSRLGVVTGDSVQQGDILAASGSTGWSTGPHVHFEIHYLDTPVDPLLLLPERVLP